jgi:uncharacterized protein (DUF302 family)
MEIYLSKTISGRNFETVEAEIIEKLKEQGFGVVTEIDMQSTFKKKLDIDFRKYKILGVCNPGYAHKAITANDKVGVLLPCNVCIQELSPAEIEVFAINPMEAMKAIKTPEMEEFGIEITKRLQSALDSLA